MRKNIGNYNACFPMPIVVVGAMVNGKPSWFEVAWTGIGERDIITLSVDPDHYTCDGIFNHSKLSVSLVNETILQRADYVGIVSGKKVDKSEVFPWTLGAFGTPIIDEADVTMECRLIDIYEDNSVTLLICQVKNTYAEESVLNEKDKVDYTKCRPVLFDPQFRYFRTGDLIGPCIKPGKEYAAK